MGGGDKTEACDSKGKIEVLVFSGNCQFQKEGKVYRWKHDAGRFLGIRRNTLL